MDTSAAVRAWVGVSRAWPAADGRPLAEVYAEDAVLRSHPFRETHEGLEGVLDYARWAFADQEGFRGCSFGEPVVAGDRAAVEYRAVVIEQGREVAIAGVSLPRFRPDALVRLQRDYWAVEPGGRPPRDGWGRQA